MEIKQLALTITENDVNHLTNKHLPADFPIQDLQSRICPEGLEISGVYSAFVRVKFESLWHLEIAENKIRIRLARAKALGLPVTIFRGKILKIIRDATRAEHWLDQQEDFLLIDPEEFLASEGWNVRLNLLDIQCMNGNCQLMAGN